MTTIHFGPYNLQVTGGQPSDDRALQQLREQLAVPPHTLYENMIVPAPLDAVADVILETHISIEAAGGLVFNADGALLMIRRRGCWDLPKGKLEPGETPAEGALREVEEETGVDRLQLTGPVADTYHAYHMYGQYVLKRTFWFGMKVMHKPELRAQAEEDITAVRWVMPGEIPGVLEQTYPNIRTLLKDHYRL